MEYKPEEMQHFARNPAKLGKSGQKILKYTWKLFTNATKKERKICSVFSEILALFSLIK
ncbi:MAG: hypothetical protein PUC62_01115 [Oscillospiraceae bacterium]|nr:hypothetical protein [Oscillospiraceae bacterium]